MNSSFPIKCLILSSIFILTFAQCKGQEFSKKEVNILNKFDLLQDNQSLENTFAVSNLKEIVRYERSRRASLAVGISVSALSLFPIAIGLALNTENGEWINDPMGNAILIAGGLTTTAISIPFYLGAKKMRKKRDHSISILD